MLYWLPSDVMLSRVVSDPASRDLQPRRGCRPEGCLECCLRVIVVQVSVCVRTVQAIMGVARECGMFLACGSGSGLKAWTRVTVRCVPHNVLAISWAEATVSCCCLKLWRPTRTVVPGAVYASLACSAATAV